MLNNHTSEHFPFLGNSVAITEMRCRSMFYTSLGRLLMVDLGEDEDRFHTFMLPLTGKFSLECVYMIRIQLFNNIKLIRNLYNTSV